MRHILTSTVAVTTQRRGSFTQGCYHSQPHVHLNDFNNASKRPVYEACFCCVNSRRVVKQLRADTVAQAFDNVPRSMSRLLPS